MFSKKPDLDSALVDYARLAPIYDHETRWINDARNMAISQLALQPGEIVADVACGTGHCLPALSHAVGADGRVIGVEPNAAMIAIARNKVDELSNVALVVAAAQDAEFTVPPDALLFSFAHDVLQSQGALCNVLAQAKRGARVVAVGSKMFPWRLATRNLPFLRGERGYVTTYRNFSRPWRFLATFLDDLEVTPLAPGNKYIVTGQLLDLPDRGQAEAWRVHTSSGPSQ